MTTRLAEGRRWLTSLLAVPIIGSTAAAQEGVGAWPAPFEKHRQRIEAIKRELGPSTRLFDNYDTPPKLMKQIRPRYPPDALQRCIEGLVLIVIVIDEKGAVPYAEILESVPEFDAEALRVVKAWRFTPARRKGRPVATLGPAPVRFAIIEKWNAKRCTATPPTE